MLGDVSLQASGDFNGCAVFLGDDLVFPIGRLRNNFDFDELLEAFDNNGRILATAKHDFGSLFLGLADESYSERAKANTKNGEKQERHKYRRDEGAAGAARLCDIFY